jgi:hypothetical protein
MLMRLMIRMREVSPPPPPSSSASFSSSSEATNSYVQDQNGNIWQKTEQQFTAIDPAHPESSTSVSFTSFQLLPPNFFTSPNDHEPPTKLAAVNNEDNDNEDGSNNPLHSRLGSLPSNLRGQAAPNALVSLISLAACFVALFGVFTVYRFKSFRKVPSSHSYDEDDGDDWDESVNLMSHQNDDEDEDIDLSHPEKPHVSSSFSSFVVHEKREPRVPEIDLSSSARS